MILSVFGRWRQSVSENKPRGMFANVANRKKESDKKARGPVVNPSEIEDGDKPFAQAATQRPASAGAKIAPSSRQSSAQSGGLAHTSDNSHGVYNVVDSKLICPWRYQDRTQEELEHDPKYAELLEGVRAHGVIEPLVVRELAEPNEDGCIYEEIVGFKRLTAAQSVGRSVPVLIVDDSDAACAVIQTQENAGRSDPSAWARAQHYLRLLDDGVFKTQNMLADSFGLDKTTVSKLLGVARKMPEDLRVSLDLHQFGSLSLRHMIAALDSEGEQLVDRLVERADELMSKPHKAVAIIDRVVEEMRQESSPKVRPEPSVYRSQKGKTLTVKSSGDRVALTFHEAALAVASAEEITSAVTDYLAKKGLTLEQVAKKK